MNILKKVVRFWVLLGNSLLFKSAWKKCPTEHWEIGKILLFHFFVFMPFQIIFCRIFGWGKIFAFFQKATWEGLRKKFKNYGRGKYFHVFPYFRYSDINMKGFFFLKHWDFFRSFFFVILMMINCIFHERKKLGEGNILWVFNPHFLNDCFLIN